MSTKKEENTVSNNNDDNSAILNALQSEYEIIQGKIDNIGNFKFVVRGWLITIYSAFVFGLFSNAISPSLTVWLGFFIIAVFHFLEAEQIINQNKLSNRAKLIEASIFKLSFFTKGWSDRKKELTQRKVLKELGSVPRVSAVLTAKRNYKLLPKDNPLPKKKKEWVAWIWNITWRVIIWLISFYTYWLFILLYISTLGLHFLINTDSLSKRIENSNENKSNTSINYFNNYEQHLNHKKHMRANASIERVEEEMYSLVSQIDYGDISDIDTYWESLRDALIDLEIEEWQPDPGLPASFLVGSLPVQDAEDLCDLMNEMKELCNSGSNSSISEEKLDELKDLATTFEKNFEKLIFQINEIGKK